MFVESLGMIVDYLALDDYESGIAVFDDLQRNQKIALLLGVSKALLRDNVSGAVRSPADRLRGKRKTG